MTIIAILIGLVIGGGIGAFIGLAMADRRGRVAAADLQTAQALAEQRGSYLQAQLAAEKAQTENLRFQLSTAQQDQATLNAQLQSAKQNLDQQRALLADAENRLGSAFATVSAEALAKNNEAFLHLARERFATLTAEATGTLDERKAQIDGLLKPMRELMGQYQQRVIDIEKSRVESYSMLREQLGTLAEAQRTLNVQTTQLVTALSRPQVRGQWGEISLRRLVELSGLSSRCDFVEQVTVGGGDESRQRPDMLVHLPGGRDVVIDCKASLDAFLEAASAADEDMRRVNLQRHAQQVRTRSRELAAKSYWTQFPQSPEYVVMFLPGEAFLYAAVEHDPSLIEDSLKNRVIIATPTTLIALLKAIEFGWRQEAITENAEQIRSLGVELYDRIAKFAEHFEKLGTTLSSAVGAYNSTVASMDSRVLVTARKISELGARSDKELPVPMPIERVPTQLPSLPA